MVSIYARHACALFYTRFAWVFLLTQAFLILSAIVVIALTAPYVSVPAVLQILPDLCLLYLPITTSIAVLFGGLLHVRELHRLQMTYWIGWANARSLHAPIYASLTLICLGLGFLVTTISPGIEYDRTRLLKQFGDEPLSWSLRMLRGQTMIPGYAMNFASFDEDSVYGLSLVPAKPNSANMLYAERARFELPAGDDPFLTLRLDRGRFLRLDDSGALSANVAFESLEYSLDSRQVFEPDPTKILGLKMYQNAELDQLEAQARHRSRRGLSLDPVQKRRVDAVTATKLARWQGALTPLLFALLVLSIAPRWTRLRSEFREVAVVLLALFVLLPEQLILDSAARKGRLPLAALALLPTAEVLALYLWSRSQRAFRA
ncbi:MAG: LptF/LptG family permease [Planctomycetota bacterium]